MPKIIKPENRKILLVFAHRGEAQQFMKRKHFQSLDFHFEGVYQSAQEWLLITGEGIQPVTEKLSAFCGMYNSAIREVINLGIAGGIDSQVEIGKIYPVRTVYRKQNNKISFSTFSSADPEAVWDCLSASERVLERNTADYLACFAPIVDRELWAVASVSKLFRLPFRAYKLISDIPGNDEFCIDIKAQAENFSQQLYEYYQQLDIHLARDEHHHISKKEPFLPESFYVTDSQYRQLKTLFRNLQIKYQLNEAELLKKIELNGIIKQEANPKKRTAMAIEKLRDLLNPFNAGLNKRLEGYCRPLKKVDCRIKFSHGYEDDSIEFSIKIKNQQHMEKFQKALQAFSHQQVIALLNGENK